MKKATENVPYAELFEAEDDAEAKALSHSLLVARQNGWNKGIRNPFWHFKLDLTGLFRVKQEEVVEPVSI